MSRTRAYRRHHEKRVKANVKRTRAWIDPQDSVLVGITARTPRPCSCSGCRRYNDEGNPKYVGKSYAIQDDLEH